MALFTAFQVTLEISR